MNNLQEYIKEKAKFDKNYNILKLFKILLATLSILAMMSCFIISTDNILINIFYFILVLFSGYGSSIVSLTNSSVSVAGIAKS